MRENRESVFFINTEALSRHGRSPRTLPPGRMCAEPNCDTRLSIYNETSYCSLHLKATINARGKKTLHRRDRQESPELPGQ